MEYISDISYKIIYQNPYVLKLAHSTTFKEQRKTMDFIGSEIVEVSMYFILINEKRVLWVHVENWSFNIRLITLCDKIRF